MVQNCQSHQNIHKDNGRIVQKIQPQRKFLHVAMMSADKFVPTRVQAAVETWASSIRTWNKNSNVDIEIFAQSNSSVGIPIVQMPGISDNVYPPQKVKSIQSKSAVFAIKCVLRNHFQ